MRDFDAILIQPTEYPLHIHTPHADKVHINNALDRRAGRVLTHAERAAWWITDDRYLRMLDGTLARAAILAEADEG